MRAIHLWKVFASILRTAGTSQSEKPHNWKPNNVITSFELDTRESNIFFWLFAPEYCWIIFASTFITTAQCLVNFWFFIISFYNTLNNFSLAFLSSPPITIDSSTPTETKQVDEPSGKQSKTESESMEFFFSRAERNFQQLE